MERIGYYFSNISYKGMLLKEPDFLFKFYDCSQWNLDALLNGYLYFPNPRNFNDPFDCLSNRETFIKNMSEGASKHRDEIGICCFSTTENNPLLWGHYAKSFTGFCVKYKNDSLIKNRNVAIRSHVSYLKDYTPSNPKFKNVAKQIDELPEGEFKKTVQHLLVMLHEYCWKYHDWKYEREFRAITINSSEFKRKLNYEKDQVLEVYIGHRMRLQEPIAFNLLTHILKTVYPEVKVFEVKPNPLVVKLEFEELYI